MVWAGQCAGRSGPVTVSSVIAAGCRGRSCTLSGADSEAFATGESPESGIGGTWECLLGQSRFGQMDMQWDDER